MQNTGKIYSRKRFIIGFKNAPNANNLEKRNYEKKRKIIKMVIIINVLLIVLAVIIQKVFCYFEPVFKMRCEEKINSMVVLITNQQSTNIMNKYQYEELYTIEKNMDNDMMIIRSNVVVINNMISELKKNIQIDLDKLESPEISISIGSLSGIYYLSGTGPKISIDMSTAGTVDTKIKSEFISQGVNQTLHRVYVDFECNMRIITPIKNYDEKVTNQVIIAEHIIVGNVPESYYNLEGMENEMDTLNVLD